MTKTTDDHLGEIRRLIIHLSEYHRLGDDDIIEFLSDVIEELTLDK